jgi:hypothetical protein
MKNKKVNKSKITASISRKYKTKKIWRFNQKSRGMREKRQTRTEKRQHRRGGRMQQDYIFEQGTIS